MQLQKRSSSVSESGCTETRVGQVSFGEGAGRKRQQQSCPVPGRNLVKQKHASRCFQFRSFRRIFSSLFWVVFPSGNLTCLSLCFT